MRSTVPGQITAMGKEQDKARVFCAFTLFCEDRLNSTATFPGSMIPALQKLYPMAQRSLLTLDRVWIHSSQSSVAMTCLITVCGFGRFLVSVVYVLEFQ